VDPFCFVGSLDELGVFHGDTCYGIDDDIGEMGYSVGTSGAGMTMVRDARTAISQTRLAMRLFVWLVLCGGTVAVSLS
jgi:hypothetical protein